MNSYEDIVRLLLLCDTSFQPLFDLTYTGNYRWFWFVSKIFNDNNLQLQRSYLQRSYPFHEQKISKLKELKELKEKVLTSCDKNQKLYMLCSEDYIYLFFTTREEMAKKFLTASQLKHEI